MRINSKYVSRKLATYQPFLWFVVILLTMTGLLYAQTNDFFTGSDGKGSNESISVTPNVFTNTLDDTARSYGYPNDSELQAALALGYSKTINDGNLWRRAKGFTNNPYPNPSGDFTVPGTNPTITIQANQYRTDCRDLHANKECYAITKTEFQAVITLTHTALIQSYDSNQQRLAAEAAGWTDNADWVRASALDYLPTSDDYTLYDESRSVNTYDGFCLLQTGVDSTSSVPCSTITKPRYLDSKTTANNGWSVADWTTARGLGYTNSAADQALFAEAKTTTYLAACQAEVPGSNSCTNLTRAQFVDAKAGTAALQQVANIAAGQPGNPPSTLTIALLEAAGMTDGVATTLSTTISTLQGDITNSGITTSSTTTDIDNWATRAAGFGTGITYSNVTTALTNNWAAPNYRVASGYAGWSNSSADNTIYGNCLTSTATGANVCTVSKSAWQATADLLASLNADSSGAGLSVADIQSVVSSQGGSSSLNMGSNPIHTAFVRNCIANLASVTTSNISNCAAGSGATPQAAARYGLANWDNGYTFNNNLLTDAGLSGADASFFANTNADSCFETSCAQVSTNYLASSSNTLTDSSTASAIETALDTAFDAHYTTKANAVPPVTNSNAPQGSTCATTTTSAPGLCSHQPSSHIYCTTSTSNFSINSPTYDTISYNGSAYAVSGTTYLNYVLQYRSRRTNSIIRSETRKIRIVSGGGFTNVFQVLSSNGGTCAGARTYCETTRGGTMGNFSDIVVSQVGPLDAVVYENAGTLRYARRSGGSGTSWMTTNSGCSGVSWGGGRPKVICNVPACP